MAFDLKLGDSMKIMADMVTEGRTVDMVLTDPPYKLTSGGKETGEMGGCFDKEIYDNGGSIVECDIDWPDFMPLLYSVLGLGCHAYVMANNRNVQAMLNAAESAGFGFHNLLVWDKITATPNRWFMKNLEFIGFFYKGKAKMINDCSAKQLLRFQQKDQTDHPTEKPVPLFESYIINSTVPGQTVFDPFMGTGASGVAAVRNQRDFIGIEKVDRYLEAAQRRILDASQQPVMF